MNQVELRSSFGAAAAAYAEHRPDYAQAAVRWALELAPGRRVLDLGAGTGKLTAALAGLGLDVIAVEPDPAMLAELQSSQPSFAPFRVVPKSFHSRTCHSMLSLPVTRCTGSTWTSRGRRLPGFSHPAAYWLIVERIR